MKHSGLQKKSVVVEFVNEGSNGDLFTPPPSTLTRGSQKLRPVPGLEGAKTGTQKCPVAIGFIIRFKS